MKILLTAALGVLLLNACQAGELHEASTSLDGPDVNPFLSQLNENLSLDLDADGLEEFIRAVPYDAELSRAISVEFGGKPHNITVVVFMDDLDTPSLFFFTESETLAKAILNEMNVFFTDRGM